jgi:hypothetical protein
MERTYVSIHFSRNFIFNSQISFLLHSEGTERKALKITAKGVDLAIDQRKERHQESTTV